MLVGQLACEVKVGCWGHGSATLWAATFAGCDMRREGWCMQWWSVTCHGQSDLWLATCDQSTVIWGGHKDPISSSTWNTLGLKCDLWLSVSVELGTECNWDGLLCVSVGWRKEARCVFTVRDRWEPEEIYATLLADPPPTFRPVRIYHRCTQAPRLRTKRSTVVVHPESSETISCGLFGLAWVWVYIPFLFSFYLLCFRDGSWWTNLFCYCCTLTFFRSTSEFLFFGVCWVLKTIWGTLKMIGWSSTAQLHWIYYPTQKYFCCVTSVVGSLLCVLKTSKNTSREVGWFACTWGGSDKHKGQHYETSGK